MEKITIPTVPFLIFFFFFALIDLWHFYFMPVNCEEIPKNLSVCSCVLPKIYLRFQKTYQISPKIKKQDKTPRLPPKNHSISNKHMKVNASIKPKCFTVKIWWATAFHSLLFPRRPAAGFSFVQRSHCGPNAVVERLVLSTQ